MAVTGPPTMDLFRAIFADSSSDSDDDSSESDDDSAKEKSPSHKLSVHVAKPTVLRESDENGNPKQRVQKSRFEPLPCDKEISISNQVEIDEKSESDLPRHVFVSKKSKSLPEESSHENVEEIPSETEKVVKVSFVKAVKSDKNAKKPRAISKSTLSFMVDEDSDGGSVKTRRKSKSKSSSTTTKLSSSQYSADDMSADNYNLIEHSNRSKLDTENVNGATDSSKKDNINSSSVKSTKTYASSSGLELKNTNVSARSNSTNKDDSLSLFSSSSKQLQSPVSLSNSRATGIFANIDFVELNRYRQQDSEISTNNNELQLDKSTSLKSKKENVLNSAGIGSTSMVVPSASPNFVKLVISDDSSSDSNSSLDSQNTYGAALPPNFVNLMQVIRGSATDEAAAIKAKESSSSKTVRDKKTKKHSKSKTKKHSKDRRRSKSRKKEKKKKHHKEKKKMSSKNKHLSSSSDSSPDG